MAPDEPAVPARKLSRAPSGYRSPVLASWLVRAGVLVSIALAGAWLAALVARWRALESGLGLRVGELRADDLTRAMALALTVSTAVSVYWVRRMYHNLRSLGVRWLRFGTGWSVWGWFVPGLNAVLPKLIIDDTWRATEVAAPHPIGHRWHDKPVPSWFQVWWWLGVAGTGLIFVEGFASDRVDTTLMLMVVAGLVLVSGLLYLRVVALMTERQRARASFVGEAPSASPESSRLGGSLTATAVMVAVVGAGFGLMTWPVRPADTKETPGGYAYQRFDVAFTYPYRFAITESGTPDEDAGSVRASSPDGTETVLLGWGPDIVSGDPTALRALLETAALGIPISDDEVVYRGRPVELVVDGEPAVLENFSIGSPSDMTYAAVMVTSCAATERVVTLVMVVETTRGIRNALSKAMVPSIRC